MTTTTDTCWADPLSRRERAELARKLARACKRSYDTARIWSGPPRITEDAALATGLVVISAEMSDLHLDVTERAEAAA